MNSQVESSQIGEGQPGALNFRCSLSTTFYETVLRGLEKGAGASTVSPSMDDGEMNHWASLSPYRNGSSCSF